ncbi:hypothetical protein DOY81_010642 [Sarcophaga bullata]|nr:hypothetical protein DOY81_010642 [Sarcophaga bullata]
MNSLNSCQWADIDVTINNLEEYCESLINFSLQDGIAKQLDAFHRGFCEVSLTKIGSI